MMNETRFYKWSIPYSRACVSLSTGGRGDGQGCVKVGVWTGGSLEKRVCTPHGDGH